MQSREYTDKDGNDRKVWEVVLQQFKGELTLLDTRKGESEHAPAPANEAPKAAGKGKKAKAPAPADENDFIP